MGEPLGDCSDDFHELGWIFDEEVDSDERCRQRFLPRRSSPS
jgi:hypothetical protein